MEDDARRAEVAERLLRWAENVEAEVLGRPQRIPGGFDQEIRAAALEEVELMREAARLLGTRA